MEFDDEFVRVSQLVNPGISWTQPGTKIQDGKRIKIRGMGALAFLIDRQAMETRQPTNCY